MKKKAASKKRSSYKKRAHLGSDLPPIEEDKFAS